jgi:hypothetical protein
VRAFDDADARARDRLARALEILDPPEAEWDRWVERVESMLVAFETLNDTKLDDLLCSKEGRAELERVAALLRKMQVSLRRFPRLEVLLVAASDVERDLRYIDVLLKTFVSRPPHPPVHKRERAAAEIARRFLKLRGVELKVGLASKWHLLTQVFADVDVDRDLRRHLTAVQGGTSEPVILSREQLLDRYPQLRAHYELHRTLKRCEREKQRRRVSGKK